MLNGGSMVGMVLGMVLYLLPPMLRISPAFPTNATKGPWRCAAFAHGQMPERMTINATSAIQD